MENKNTYIILSTKSWNSRLVENLKKITGYDFVLINNKQDFNLENLKKINPSKIFIPHWSYIIHEDIYSHYNCVVFHMTDLPFGRGGSPLQNLIVRGFKETKVSAINIEKGIDTGPIYLKKDLSLLGTAEEVFLRLNTIIEEMIVKIINENIQPIQQQGVPVIFKRRIPKDSFIGDLIKLEEIYDHIRMLDADGYPKAFLEFGDFKIEFSRASLKADNSIIADVRIIQK